jgi:acyl-CoA synthetase (AMP-forming)/AMP-acid ligase II
VVSERLGSVFFPIDLDPRWVKKLAVRHATQEMSGYVDHCLEQAAFVLQTQDVGNLHITPPLLEALARDDALVDLVNEQVRYVLLSGAHVDLDTMDLFREIFPDAAITMVFGSTMILSQARTRLESDWDSWIFDPQTPYIVFRVVDPETGAEVPYGERGQVVMNHISKGMFLPNNLERDTAVRVPGPNGQVGDSLTEVAPVARFEGEPVIEGVY